MSEQQPTNPYASPHGIQWDAGVDVVNAVAVDDDGSLAIDYEIEVEDLIKFSLHRHRTNPTLRRAFLRSWIIFTMSIGAIGMMIAILRATASTIDATPIILFGSISVIFAVLYPMLHRRAVRRLVGRIYSDQQRDGIVGSHRLVITRAALTDLTSVSKASWKWCGIETIVVTPDAVYIVLMSLNAVIVPNRSFGSQSELNSFVESARRFHSASDAQ